MFEPLFNLVAGFGILWFSLRYYTTAIRAGMRTQLYRSVLRFIPTNFRALLIGVLLTVLVQESSVTIILAMSLASLSLISLPRSIMMMLGATLGTTLKGVFFYDNLSYVGSVFIFIGTMVSFFFRNSGDRRLTDSVIMIGITIFGLSMVKSALRPLGDMDFFSQLFLISGESDLSSLIQGLGAGFSLSAVFQSSSVVLLTVLDLAKEGYLEAYSAVAMVLGANLGIVITSLIVSLYYSNQGKRVALAHLIVKAVGVLICTLFFRTFMTISQIFVEFLPAWAHQPHHLVSVSNVLFNSLNVLVWWLMLPLLVRSVERILPDDKTQSAPLQSPVLNQILMNLPKQVLREIKKEAILNLELVRYYLIKASDFSLGGKERKSCLDEYHLRQDLLKECLMKVTQKHPQDPLVLAQCPRLIELITETQVAFELIEKVTSLALDHKTSLDSQVTLAEFKLHSSETLERIHQSLLNSERIPCDTDLSVTELKRRSSLSISLLDRIQEP